MRKNVVDGWIVANQGKHFCQCGCGNPIIIKKHHKWVGIPKYLSEHRHYWPEGKRRIDYGKPKSDIHKQKIANAHKGKVKSETHLVALRIASKINGLKRRGCKFSPEHKKRISVGLTGRTFSIAHREAISRAVSGEKSYRWAGGKSREPYPLAFGPRLKKRIKSYYNNTCQLCGLKLEKYTVSPYRTLQVHHIDYYKENLSDDNLIALCNSCNSKVNCNRAYWAKYFKCITANKVKYNKNETFMTPGKKVILII